MTDQLGRENEREREQERPEQETDNPGRQGPETTPMAQTDLAQDEEGTTDPGGR